MNKLLETDITWLQKKEKEASKIEMGHKRKNIATVMRTLIRNIEINS